MVPLQKLEKGTPLLLKTIYLMQKFQKVRYILELFRKDQNAAAVIPVFCVIITFVLMSVFLACMGWMASYERFPSISSVIS